MTDWDTIVGQKVNQLNSLGDDPSAWDADSFLAILGDYGYDSVESWYEDSGQYEDLDSYSDTTSSTTSTTSEEETDWDEILKQKANQLNDIEYGGSTDWTASTAKAAIEAEGYTVEDWYDQWGKDESLDDYSELLGMTQDEFLDSDVGSYSGLPEEYNEQLLEWLMPLLESSFSNYTTNIDESSEAATEAATQAGRSAMSETAQGVLNSMASRGIFGGSVAENAMASGLAEVATDISDTAFASAAEAAALKAEEPSLLTSLLNYGTTSESYNEVAPWSSLLDKYIGMMPTMTYTVE